MWKVISDDSYNLTLSLKWFHHEVCTTVFWALLLSWLNKYWNQLPQNKWVSINFYSLRVKSNKQLVAHFIGIIASKFRIQNKLSLNYFVTSSSKSLFRLLKVFAIFCGVSQTWKIEIRGSFVQSGPDFGPNLP